MTYFNYQQLEDFFKQGYTFLPVVIKTKLSMFNPLKLLHNIKSQDEYSFIFESGKIGDYTYIGGDPLHIIKEMNSKTIKINRDKTKEEFYGDPLKILTDIMDIYTVPRINNMPQFYGGAVGFLSYDMVKYFENIPSKASDDLRISNLYFIILDKLWAYDHRLHELFYIEYIFVEDFNQIKDLYYTKIRKMQETWNKLMEESDFFSDAVINYSTEDIDYSMIETSLSEKEYIKAVKRVQEYILQGDVFQVNLSIRQNKILKTEGYDIYSHLRKINPSPYMGLLNFPDIQIVSCSPELLIKIENGVIQTRPIAGTRPRAFNEAKDEELLYDLLHNKKEIAEHIMLVDLERNDLGRVCNYGTVKVNELMTVEKYSHVMHIVSNVVGKISSNFSLYDCIKATFPGGTITGAPKIRTMEIIEELEPVKRGPYTGSMGWIGFNGDLELNILIRSLIIKEGTGYIQAGAGIVIDSIPKNEYIESLNKAEALWRAVESSEKEMIRRLNL